MSSLELQTNVDDLIDWKAVWDASVQSFGDETQQLATWWSQGTEGVNYYRAHIPAKHLPGRAVRLDDERGVQLDPDDPTRAMFLKQRGGTAIWMFPANVVRWLLMAEMHVQGYRVLVEVDDNYLVPTPTSPGLNSGWTTGKNITEEKNASFLCHRKIVESDCVHGVVVSTPKLGEVYERFGKPVYVCPNSVDVGDWDFPVEHSPDGVLRVGWAGSTSHRYDLADIRPALDWAARQRDVEVVVLGQLDVGVGERRIQWIDSLEEYRRKVSEIDVMLCSLRPGVWQDCKSDAKALEGAMGGALPVVSKVEAYRPWWDKGYVAETPKDFLKIVKHLVGNREETRKAAADARAYVLAEREISKTVGNWEAIV